MELPERSQTIRQAILSVLGETAPMSLRDISVAVGVPEREVLTHLTHLQRHRSGAHRLTVLPARCVLCGFVFTKRDRVSRPSRCPVCRGERIEAPRFELRSS